MKFPVTTTLLAVASFTACPAPPVDGPVGGPVEGAADTHCDSVTPVVTDPSVCAGVGEGEGEGGVEEEAPVLFNAEGDDDDCKYHVAFSVTDVRPDSDVTFTVTLTKLADGTPATGAGTDTEIFLDDTHPAPNTDATTEETSPGVYTIGPVQFDAAGRWTTRFHFFEDCVDSETSEHGHVAFFIDVP